MAKIVEARLEDGDILHSEGARILIERPKRPGGVIWAAVFAVMLFGGAMIGLTLASGPFSNTMQVTQNVPQPESDTATN